MTKRYALHQYNNLHRSKPWFGRGLEESLEEIPASDYHRPVGHRTIAGLCLHALAWRYDFIKRITDTPREKIELDTDRDWPEASSYGKAYFLSEFARTKTEILAALEAFDYGKADDLIHPDYDYTWTHILEGGVQHDIYHLGQINLLAVLLTGQDQ